MIKNIDLKWNCWGATSFWVSLFSLFSLFSTMWTHAQACICWSKYTTPFHSDLFHWIESTSKNAFNSRKFSCLWNVQCNHPCWCVVLILNFLPFVKLNTNCKFAKKWFFYHLCSTLESQRFPVLGVVSFC